jgi:predicted membrane channel-forming protein YqfA (hemolysin III family)
MRLMLATMLGLSILLTLPAAAAPLAAKAAGIESAAASAVVPVAGGCGYGWHRRHWQDRWGYWHWGRCVPN